jgi:hypothetical protein
MEWDVQFDAAFTKEAKAFSRAVQIELAALVVLLKQCGPQLRRPHCDTLKGSKHSNMKELRFTLADGEWRVAFAFVHSGMPFYWSGEVSRGRTRSSFTGI